MKTFLVQVFAIVVLLAIAASAYYTGHRLRVLLDLSNRWLLPVIFIVVVAGALVAAGLAVRSTNSLVGTLYVWGGYAITLQAYLLILLLAHYVIQLGWSLPPKGSALVIIALAVVATLAGSILAFRFSVRETEIPISKLNGELRVLQISDVHLGHHRGKDYLEKVVAEANRQNPDLVLITGDLVDSDVALLPGVLDPLSTLTTPAYFVTGNHEKTVDLERALALIASNRVRVLRNEVVEAKGIQIVGLDYMNADEDTLDLHPSTETRTIKSTLPALPIEADTPSILMHHSPVGTSYAEVAGIDLVLTGHTHAGQIFPFTLLTEALFPFNRGLHQQGKTKVFVSEGAGTYMVRARLRSTNEINLLRLVPASQ